MKKKLLSLLLVIAVMMTSVSMGFGSLVATAGVAGGGVEAINAFSLVQNGDATGTTFNTSVTIKSKASGYQIKVNSLNASIRYAQDESTAYSTFEIVSAAGAVVGTGGQNFNVSATIASGLSGIIRYECNYDLLDSSGKAIYKGMTGYGYGAVAADGSRTGALGSWSGEPGTKKPYYYNSFAPINSCYVQTTGFELKYETETAWQAGGTSSKNTTPYVESGTAPSTLTFGEIRWSGVGAFSGAKTASGTWCKLTTPASGYYNFTVFVYSPNSSDLHAPVEIYYRDPTATTTVLNNLNNYLGKGLEKSYYTEASWNKYLAQLDKLAAVAMTIPGTTYAFQYACNNVDAVKDAKALEQARNALELVLADYTEVYAKRDEFLAIKDNTVEVKTYEAGKNTLGSFTISLYSQAAINAVYDVVDAYNLKLYRFEQLIVDGYAAEIESMTKNLAYSDADYTYLDNAIEEYETLKEKQTENDIYVAATWIRYENAANNAKAVSRSLKANEQSSINNALQNLFDRRQELELFPADTNALSEQLGIANDIIKEYNEGKLFTGASGFDAIWEYFLDTYEVANEVASYTKDKQAEVDAAYKNLAFVNERLAKYRILDTKALEDALALKPEYDKAYYVTTSYDSWNRLRKEGYDFVEKADVEYTGDDRKSYADRDEMNALIELVVNAFNSLEKIKADFTELDSYVSQIPSEEVLVLYKEEYVKEIREIVASIDYGTPFDEQDRVDAIAESLKNALTTLTYENYRDADYSGVEAAIAAANALNRDEYANFNVVDNAIAAVDYTKKIVEQDEVDAMEKAIRDAIKMLGYVLADYSDVEAAIAEAEAVENKDWYANYNRVEAIIAGIDWTITLENQSQVDAYAAAIRQAIVDLKLADADYSAVNDALDAARAIEPLSDFDAEFATALDNAVKQVEAGYKKDRQVEVDQMAARINEILATADDHLKRADYSRLEDAIEYAKAEEKTGEYTNYNEVVQPVIDSLDMDLKCRNTADKKHVQIMQDQIDAVYAAVGNLQLKPADYTKYDEAVTAAREAYSSGEYPYSVETIAAVEEAIGSIGPDLNIRQQADVDKCVIRIQQAVEALRYERADYTELDELLAQVEIIKKKQAAEGTYVSIDAVVSYVNNIDMNITCDNQGIVDNYETELSDLIKALVFTPADYSRIKNSEADFNNIIKNNRNYYYEEDIKAVNDALDAVEYGLTKEHQAEVNEMADAVESALLYLKGNMKPADLSELRAAMDAAYDRYNEMTATGFKVESTTWQQVLNLQNEVNIYDDSTKINKQSDIDALTEAIIEATANLEYVFQIIWKDSGLFTEGSGEAGSESYVYGFEEGVMASDARELLQFVGAAELKIYETANGFGTGTVIRFISTKDGRTLAEYTVLVFGDANGDAVIDTYDVAYIAAVVNSNQEADVVTRKVLDIENDGYLDALDVSLMIGLANMDGTLMQDGSMVIV